MKQELVRRMEQRGTPYQTIKNDDDKFYDYYVSVDSYDGIELKPGAGEVLEKLIKNNWVDK